MVRGLVAALVLTALCACPAPEVNPLTTERGTPSGMATTAMLGAAGGTFRAGALTITVPAGVLSADTAFTATPITATAPGVRGQAMRLGPEGQTFSAPVKVSFTYGDEDLAGTSPEALLIAYQHSSGIWAVPGDVTLDTATRTLTVETTHFSDWSKVAGAQLLPNNATVKVGASAKFTASNCFKPYSSAPDPLLVGLRLGFPCDVAPTDNPDLAPLIPLVKDWSVNSVPGGSGTTGTVSGDAVKGTYTAPGTKPMPAVVAVSATLQTGKGSTLLVANVTITDGARIRVTGRYAAQSQAVGETVIGDVTDEGFQFEMAWGQIDGMVSVKNFAGGGVTNVRDTRAGCLTPSVNGQWDQLRVDAVTIIASFFQVAGQQTTVGVTLGVVGEGNCANTAVTYPGGQSPGGMQVGFPTQFFTGGPPPVGAPWVDSPQDAPGWTFTYATLP